MNIILYIDVKLTGYRFGLWRNIWLQEIVHKMEYGFDYAKYLYILK